MSENEVGSQMLSREELKAALMEQEHRLFRLCSNWYSTRKLPHDSEIRLAASKAIFLRILWSFLPHFMLVGGTGVVGIIGILLAWQANSLLSAQNKLLQDELAFSKLPSVAFEGSVYVPMKLDEESKDWFIDDDKDKELNSLPILRNYGKGPAFDVQVFWFVEGVEQPVQSLLESQQLYPESISRVDRLPTFEEETHSSKGVVKVQYRDLDGSWREVRQNFRTHFFAEQSLLRIHIDDCITPPLGQRIEQVETFKRRHWGF